MSRCSNSSKPLKSQNNSSKYLLEKNIEWTFDGLFHPQKAVEWFLKHLSKVAVGCLWKGWGDCNTIWAYSCPFLLIQKKGEILRRGGKRQTGDLLHPHSLEGLLQMQKLPLQKIFIATLRSPLRTHEDAKSSNMRKSIQVLHLFPFISLCSSPVGIYRIKIFVGVLLFSLLLSTLSLFLHFLSSPSVVWAISTATRTR